MSAGLDEDSKEEEAEVQLWPRSLQRTQSFMARSVLSGVAAEKVRRRHSIRRGGLRKLGRGFETPDIGGRQDVPLGTTSHQYFSVPSLSEAKASLRALAALGLAEKKKLQRLDEEAELTSPTSSKHEATSEDGEFSPRSSHDGTPFGTSTRLQAILNTTNVLLGTGLLALPYAVRCTGGYLGLSFVLIAASGATLFTAKILGTELQRRQARGFPDLALYTFGHRGRIIVALVLYADIFLCLVLFIIIAGTNTAAVTNALFPSSSSQSPTFPYSKHSVANTDDDLILLGAVESMAQWLFMTPTGCAYLMTAALLPATALDDLSTLSKFSAVGTVATVSLVLIVTLAAVACPDAAAAAAASSEISNTTNSARALSIGLTLYCFAGHALFPSIYWSLEEPEKDWNSVVNISYAIVCLSCLIVASAGYLLFGNDVSEQISVDLGKIDRTTGAVCCGLIAISALSKFALELQPVALGIEELFEVCGGSTSRQSKQSSDDRARLVLADDEDDDSKACSFLRWSLIKKSRGITLRIAILLAALICAVSLPGFAVVDSLLGAIFATLISIVFPCSASLYDNPNLTTRHKNLCILTIFLGIVAGVCGTWGSAVQASMA